MFKMLKIVSRNKLFYIFAALIALMFPSTLYHQSDKDLTTIITTIGVDIKDDKLDVSAIAVIPSGGGDITANVEVFEGQGETISEALNDISTNTGKKIGLAHCDTIVLSLDTMNKNITHYLDYFIRTANLTTNATLISTDGKSKDLLEATKSSNNLLDLSLRTIVLFEEERSLLEGVNIERFYKTYYSSGSTFYLPLFSTKESQSSSGGSGGGSNEEESSGGGGQQQSSSGQKKIVNRNKIAVIKNGIYERTLGEDEYYIYNLLSGNSKYGNIVAKNVSDSNVSDSNITFEQQHKILMPKYYFDGDTPTAKYTILLFLRVDEIIGENFSYSSIDRLQNFLTPAVQEVLQNQISDKLKNTITSMKDYDDDLLGLYNKFDSFERVKWQNYLSTLDSETHFIDGVNIVLDVKLYGIA